MIGAFRDRQLWLCFMLPRLGLGRWSLLRAEEILEQGQPRARQYMRLCSRAI